MRLLVDDDRDPYALWTALEDALKLYDAVAHHDVVASMKNSTILRRLHEQLRPPADRAGGGQWVQRMSPGTVRVHHVVTVECTCGWERIVWPDEAQDALNSHLRKDHEKRGSGYDDHAEHLRVRAPEDGYGRITTERRA